MSDPFLIDACKVCEKECWWILAIDGILAEKMVCSPECLAKLDAHLDPEVSTKVIGHVT